VAQPHEEFSEPAVAVWDMELGTLIARGQTGEAEVRDCAVTPDGGRVISVHASGRVTIWDLRTMAVLATLDAPSRQPAGGTSATSDAPERCGATRRWRRFALSADGNRLALAGWDVKVLRRAQSSSETDRRVKNRTSQPSCFMLTL
jgi:WD40 repeat protein